MKIVRGMRWWATVLSVWLCGLPAASAQSEDWLVLPTATDDATEWMAPVVGGVGRALRKQGIGVWPPSRTVARIEEVGPRPPQVISPEQYDAWRARTSEAVLQLAGGRYQEALPRLEESLAFSRGALETLNRDPTRAQAVLDTCLFLVRALAGVGDGRRAARQAQECVALSPGMELSTFMHPPDVTELFEEAKQNRGGRTSALLVESEPPGCALFVNGKRAGETPTQLTELFPGKYRAQVECDGDRPGPVHLVDVSSGAQTLFVFDAFDQAVALEPVLHLQYDLAPQKQNLIRHARELARVLPASSVVLAAKLESGAIELRLIRGAQMEPVWVTIAGPGGDADTRNFEAAVAALLSGGCGDFSGQEPVAMDCDTRSVVREEEVASLPRRPPPGQLITGLTLAGVGTASLLTGYGLLIARKSSGDDWLSDPQNRAEQQTWVRLGTAIIGTGVGGSTLLVSAMPLVLPYKRKTPWWGWLTGGLGLASGAAAIALAVTAPPPRDVSCRESGPEPQECVDRARRTDLALLLGMTAAPLITIPLVYLFRKDDKRYDATLVPGVSVSSGAAVVAVRGVF